LPPQPRADWPVDAPTLPVGFVPGTRILVAGRVMAAWDEAVRGATVGPLRSYDADTGRVTDWLPGGEAVAIRTIALSPDGKRATVARGGAGKSFHLFDPVTARKLIDLPLANGAVNSVSFSADGQWLAYSEAGADGGCVHVWDVAAAKELGRLRPAAGQLAFAPDGRTLAVADETEPKEPLPLHIRVWATASGKLLRDWEGPVCGGCTNLQFAPDGQRLVAAFSQRDSNTFPNPARTSRGRPWAYHAQIRGWDVAGGDEAFRVGCDFPFIPRSQPWFATLTHLGWPPPVGSPSVPPWSIFGFDGRELPSGAAIYEYDFTWQDAGRAANRLLIVVSQRDYSPVQSFLDRIGVRWRFPHTKTARARFVDVRTSEEVGNLPPWPFGSLDNFGRDGRNPSWVAISPAEDLSAVEHNGYIRIWDISPGTPWTWFAVIAGSLALPLALVARRRIRLAPGIKSA